MIASRRRALGARCVLHASHSCGAIGATAKGHPPRRRTHSPVQASRSRRSRSTPTSCVRPRLAAVAVGEHPTSVHTRAASAEPWPARIQREAEAPQEIGSGALVDRPRRDLPFPESGHWAPDAVAAAIVSRASRRLISLLARRYGVGPRRSRFEHGVACDGDVRSGAWASAASPAQAMDGGGGRRLSPRSAAPTAPTDAHDAPDGAVIFRVVGGSPMRRVRSPLLPPAAE